MVFCNGAGQIAANDSDGAAPHIWRLMAMGAEARNANEKAAVLSIRQGRGEGLAVSTRPVTIVLCFVGQ